tara:strand:- start:2945 stop:4408 length:1464 start_codon:yes stop_codon:yes gene_type:complete
MAVQVNRLPVGALQQRSMAPQITARGRQLQSSAPPIPKSGIGAGMAGLGKSLGEIADTIKESRQKANRAKLVRSLVQEDDATEADAFDAPAPMTPSMQTAEATGLMADADAFDVTPTPPTPIAPATPNASKLSKLNMPDQAKTIFKDLVNSGDTDGAYKIAMAFAMKPKEQIILGEGQGVFERQPDGTLKETARRPKTFAPPKPVAPKILWDRKLKKNRSVSIAEQRANPNNFAEASKATDLYDPDGNPFPKRIETQMKLKQAGVPQPDNLFKKGLAEIYVKEYGASRDRANDARNRLNNFAEAAAMLDNIERLGGTTGIGTEEYTAFKKFANRFFGADYNESLIASEEAFAAKSGQLAMDYISQTKGAISDREMARFDKMSPNLQTSVEGNRHIMAYAQIRARQEIRLQKLADAYIKQNGRLDHGFDEIAAQQTQELKAELDNWYLQADDIRRARGSMDEQLLFSSGGDNNTNNVVNKALGIVRRK